MSKAKDTTTAVAVQETGGLPAYLQGFKGPTGQDFSREDIQIPQIKIGQGTSDEVKEGLLDEGDLFLNVDGTVLAKAGTPLRMVIVGKDTEYLLWRDRKDQTGDRVMARAKRVKLSGPMGDYVKHKWDKPNQTFETKLNGQLKVQWTTGEYVEDDGLGEWGSEIPGDTESKIAAQKHFNYVVYLPDQDMVASLSLSRTATKPAKSLNTLLMMGGAPIFARVIEATSYTDQRNGDKFANWKFRVPAGGPEAKFVSAETFAKTSDLFKQFEAEGFAVDHTEAGEAAPGADGETAEGKF